MWRLLSRLRITRRTWIIGLITLALWGITVGVWYFFYRIFVSVQWDSFVWTFAVLPVPFVVDWAYRRLSRYRWFHHLKRPLAILIGITAAILIGVRLAVILGTGSQIHAAAGVPSKPVAIVFGAGLYYGRPSPELVDRLDAAVALYKHGRVGKLLMSGDNRFVDYDEPTAMRDYAVQAGVPAGAIVRDFAGRRTYDTCYRARDIFKVKDAILVSQRYHLPRALYICSAFGLNVVGVSAGRDDNTYAVYGQLREVPATLAAWWEVNLSHPIPVLGSPEPIFGS
jgi:SanA protein